MKTCARCQHEQPSENFRLMDGGKRTMTYCRSCEAEYKKEWYAKNKQTVLDRSHKWSEENRERKAATDKEYRERNRERIAATKREHAAANVERDNKKKAEWAEANRNKVKAAEAKYRSENRAACNSRIAAWKKANSDKNRSYSANRWAAKRTAIPSWFSELDEIAVREAHALAVEMEQATGVKWHVDHIVPLKSKLVCGLHCAANLAVIPATINVKKNNRVWPFMPEAV